MPIALGYGFLMTETLVRFLIPMSSKFYKVNIYLSTWVPLSSEISTAYEQDWFYGFYFILDSSASSFRLHVDFIIS